MKSRRKNSKERSNPHLKIAPNVDASEWKKLDLTSEQGADWTRAIEIFRERIETRYLQPVDLLVGLDENRLAPERRFGFTVLAIDCLLVETLQAFTEGRTNTERVSRSIFVTFLTTRRLFRHFFDAALAERFYKEIRCGILHQAETTGNTRIWSVGPLVQIDGQKLILNRSEFHKRLRGEFDTYVSDLAGGADKKLRTNFRAKMDYICSFAG